ncbi:UDP-glycosyltransferase 74E2 [Striga hermonthica]|uniref:anthocyanidin 3-O-glucoside 5-O-glucosyltransferase n=1 Tax=Striga hermonthica TaxID=68872 RepID=A0A9N7MUZ9_STRHE|nr:UDP-glycosyltransferase 74E2 [Striga hermonthica]
MAKFSPVKAIGPIIPSMYLDKKLLDDTDYGLSVYKPVREACMDWLNKRQPESVIYVSFGSMAVLDEKQTQELAWGLKLSNKHFLWVVRSSEQTKLPQEITQDTSGKGLIVSWCSQLDVLSHAAICYFLTHCGWNSTLEALSLGVPMVAMPQWTDQSTNSKFVMDVWKMGVRAISDDNGLVGRETNASSIREVLEGDRKEEIKKNAIKWKELVREAMDEGGSSDENIDEFVTTLSTNSSSVMVLEKNRRNH